LFVSGQPAHEARAVPDLDIVSVDQDLRLIEGSIIRVGFDDVALDNVVVLVELERTKSFRHDMAPQRCRNFRSEFRSIRKEKNT
jgi:hypothetical protein